MDEQTLAYIRGRNYLAPEDDLSRFSGQEALLVWGKHREKPPLVTVAIPAYKRLNLLKLALKSALEQQNFEDYQILIVDDCADEQGENSETECYIRQLNDERIVYYRNRRNLGLMGNWNMCYLLSRSPWVCSLHDDDFLTANFLEKMAAVVTKYPDADAVFNLATRFDGDTADEKQLNELAGPLPIVKGRIMAQKVWRLTFNFTAGRTTGSFIKKEAFLKMGGFGPDHVGDSRDIIYNDDYVLSTRLFANCACYILPQSVYNYRIGSNNGSARVKDYIPDLCQEYWMSRQLCERLNPLLRLILRPYCGYALKAKAENLDKMVREQAGRMNAEARVDFDELCRVCGLKKLPDNPGEEKVLRGIWNLYFSGRRVWDRIFFSKPMNC